jgi:hypothetical protein
MDPLNFKQLSDESLLSLAENGNRAKVEIDRRSYLPKWQWAIWGKGLSSGNSFVVSKATGFDAKSDALQAATEHLRNADTFCLRTWDKCMYWIKVTEC